MVNKGWNWGHRTQKQNKDRRKIKKWLDDPMLTPIDHKLYRAEVYDKKTGSAHTAPAHDALMSRRLAERTATDIYLALDKKVGVRIIPEALH